MTQAADLLEQLCAPSQHILKFAAFSVTCWIHSSCACFQSALPSSLRFAASSATAFNSRGSHAVHVRSTVSLWLQTTSSQFLHQSCNANARRSPVIPLEEREPSKDLLQLLAIHSLPYSTAIATPCQLARVGQKLGQDSWEPHSVWTINS